MKYYFETVKYNKNLPARVLLQDKPGHRCDTSLHWHRELEIVYLEEGSLRFEDNENRTLIKPGEMFFVNSAESHFSNSPTKDQINKYIVILLSIDYLKKHYVKPLESLWFNVNNNQSAKDEIIVHVKNIYKAMKEQKDFYQLEIESELLKIYKKLLCDCIEYKKSSIIDSKNMKFLIIKKAIEYIGTNFKEQICLNEISAYVGLSPSYFSRHFKEITNSTFIDYLNVTRLEHALLDMRHENFTVTEAAFENGFSNVKSFITVCKKRYGCTPKEYKKKHEA